MLIYLLRVKMNFIIFLAVVALGSAHTLYGSEKEIRVYEGKILIRTPKIIVAIEKSKDDDKILQVTIKYINQMVEIIKIDNDMNVKKLFVLKKSVYSQSAKDEENVQKRANTIEPRTFRQYVESESSQEDTLEKTNFPLRNSQMVVLANMFKKYEGVIGETSFKRLLTEAMNAVRKGKLHPVIFDVLRDLELENFVYTPVESWKEQTMNLPGSNEVTREQDTFKELKEDDKVRDKKQELDFSGMSNNDKPKNKLDPEVERQIQWIQQLVKQRSEPLDEFQSTESTEGVSTVTEGILKSDKDFDY